MENNLENRLEALGTVPFKINGQAIRDAFEYKKKHDPAFAHMTLNNFALKIGIGESTWKKILSDKAPDAMCSTVTLICKALGISADEVLGLVPQRDYSKESYDSTLMDNLRKQLGAVEEKVESKRERIAELENEKHLLMNDIQMWQDKYHEAHADLRAAEEHTKHAETHVKEHEKRVKRYARGLTVSIVLAVVLGALLIYLLWELRNPADGMFRF